VLAVRQKSPALIEQGLTVLTVLGEVDDTRDLTFYLATLYHAATKLEIDAVGLFRGVACMCPSTAPSTFLRDAMSGFPLRRAEDRDLRAFWLREAVTDEGFGFAQAGK
jgi:hypothetical protein